MAPHADVEGLRLCARSLLGQVLIHRIYRPFFQRHGPPNRYGPEEVQRIADHIARFSLQGLGCSATLVERALELAAATPGAGA